MYLNHLIYFTQVKLFSQWNRRWPLEFKEKLQQKITEIDDKVGERIKESLNRRHNGCGSLTNGYAGTSGDDDDDEVHHYECNANTATKDHYPSQTSSNHQNESHVKEEAQQQQQPNEIIVGTNAVQLNDPMREVLSNETSVDDIEPNEQQQVNINRPGEGTDNVAHAFDSGINDDFNNTSHVPPEPVEQVVQMRNLQINEDGGHEEVTASIPGAPSAVQQQSSHTSTTPVTITVSAIAQSMTTNTEVPLVA